MNIRSFLSVVAASAALYAMRGTACAQIFVSDVGNGFQGRVSEYNVNTGALINPALISPSSPSAIFAPNDIALSGNTFFVSDYTLGTIGEYTTSGQPIRRRLITLGNIAARVEVSGGYLFVSEPERDRISKYTTSGKTVDLDLIPGAHTAGGGGLNAPVGMAISGDKLFVVNAGSGTIGEYTTSGVPINPTLISGLYAPNDIAISGDKLFVTTANVVSEYTTSGMLVNPALISTDPRGGVGDIALSGGNLFLLVNGVTETIHEYTTSGVPLNMFLVPEVVDRQPSSLLVVPGSVRVPDTGSTWLLLLVGVIATIGSKRLLYRSV